MVSTLGHQVTLSLCIFPNEAQTSLSRCSMPFPTPDSQNWRAPVRTDAVFQLWVWGMGGVCYVAVDNQTPGHSSITPCVRYEVPGSHTPRLPCVAKEVRAALCKDHRQSVTLTVGAASCRPHRAVAAGHSVDPGLESRAPPPLPKGWKTGWSTERSDVRVSGGHTRHPWRLRTRKAPQKKS